MYYLALTLSHEVWTLLFLCLLASPHFHFMFAVPCCSCTFISCFLHLALSELIFHVTRTLHFFYCHAVLCCFISFISCINSVCLFLEFIHCGFFTFTSCSSYLVVSILYFMSSIPCCFYSYASCSLYLVVPVDVHSVYLVVPVLSPHGAHTFLFPYFLLI